MWAPTQINEGTATIHCTFFPRHQLINIVQLILAVREHLFKIFLRNFQSIEALLFLKNAGCFAVKGRPIRFLNDTSAQMLVPGNSRFSRFLFMRHTLPE